MQISFICMRSSVLSAFNLFNFRVYNGKNVKTYDFKCLKNLNDFFVFIHVNKDRRALMQVALMQENEWEHA